MEVKNMTEKEIIFRISRSSSAFGRSPAAESFLAAYLSPLQLTYYTYVMSRGCMRSELTEKTDEKTELSVK